MKYKGMSVVALDRRKSPLPSRLLQTKPCNSNHSNEEPSCLPQLQHSIPYVKRIPSRSITSILITITDKYAVHRSYRCPLRCRRHGCSCCRAGCRSRSRQGGCELLHPVQEWRPELLQLNRLLRLQLLGADMMGWGERV
jgi:hypothetical protein